MDHRITSVEEERLFSLFQPDILIPAQYVETFRRKICFEPEKRLMAAVLEEAVMCFQKCLLARDERQRRMFCDAEAWILEEDVDWPFSFDNICEVLGLNPRYVRQGLMRWRNKKFAKSSKAKIYRLLPRCQGKKTDAFSCLLFRQRNCLISRNRLPDEVRKGAANGRCREVALLFSGTSLTRPR